MVSQSKEAIELNNQYFQMIFKTRTISGLPEDGYNRGSKA